CRIGAVDQPVAVVVRHVAAVAGLGPGRHAGHRGGRRQDRRRGGGDRGGGRGDRRGRGRGAHDVRLVADAVRVAAGGGTGVVVRIRARRAVGKVRERADAGHRVADARAGAGVVVVGAGGDHMVLVAAVDDGAAGGERAVAPRRRAQVVIGVRAGRAGRLRRVHAGAHRLIAAVLRALDVVVAVRTQRDRARLLAARREPVVAAGVVLRREIAGDLLDLVRGGVRAPGENFDVELQVAEAGRDRLVGRDHEGGVRREHHLVGGRAGGVPRRPRHTAVARDRRVPFVLDLHAFVGTRDAEGHAEIGRAHV